MMEDLLGMFNSMDSLVNLPSQHPALLSSFWADLHTEQMKTVMKKVEDEDGDEEGDGHWHGFGTRLDDLSQRTESAHEVFVENQVQLTKLVLSSCDTQEKLRERITASYDYPRAVGAEIHNPETLMKRTVRSAVDPWFELSDRVQDEISFRLIRVSELFKLDTATFCPFTLKPRPSSDGEFDPLRFVNIDGGGDFHFNEVDTSSMEQTRRCYKYSNNFAGNVLPSLDPDLSKDFWVVGARGLSCIDLGKAGGSEKLVMHNPTATDQIFKVLPPLVMHPQVMHLRVDDSGHYKVFVAGSATIDTEDPSFMTLEYSSTTGIWDCIGNLPCPWFGVDKYQNGVYFTDSKRELLLCVAILDTKLGTKGVLMYDFTKKQWVQGPIIPLIRPSESASIVSYIATMHVVGCGGSIFVFCEQICEQDVYSCAHKLNLDSTSDDMWEECMRHTRIGARALLVYPEYTCIPITYSSFLSATVIAESGFMFTEEEVGKEVFICIYKLTQNGSGSDGVWNEIVRRKRKRSRAPNWKATEIIAFLKVKEEGLGVVKGKDWDFISLGLGEKYGFIRGSKACEDLWGTLLKRHTDIQNDLKNIHPGTSAWANFWKQGGNDRSKSKVFSVECYEMMDRILGRKPRKKAGGNKKRMVDASAPWSSSQSDSLSSLQVSNNPLPSAPLVSETFVESFNNSLNEGDDQQSKDERPAMSDIISEVAGLTNYLLKGGQHMTNKQIAKTKEEALKVVKSKYQLEILKEKNKARDRANRRPTKSRKMNA